MDEVILASAPKRKSPPKLSYYRLQTPKKKIYKHTCRSCLRKFPSITCDSCTLCTSASTDGWHSPIRHSLALFQRSLLKEWQCDIQSGASEPFSAQQKSMLKNHHLHSVFGSPASPYSVSGLEGPKRERNTPFVSLPSCTAGRSSKMVKSNLPRGELGSWQSNQTQDAVQDGLAHWQWNLFKLPLYVYERISSVSDQVTKMTPNALVT